MDVEKHGYVQPERTPFWSSKYPEITTMLGKSQYHFSGFHTQTVSGDKLTMDNLSLLGQRLSGSDLGPMTITLKEPLTAALAADGSFKAETSLILSSGATTSTIPGEVTGMWAKSSGKFTSLCVSARADRATFALNQGVLSSHVSVALA
jgi:hypothetical protein